MDELRYMDTEQRLASPFAVRRVPASYFQSGLMPAMNGDFAIRVTGLGKCYRIYNRPIDRLLQGVIGRSRARHAEFWALQALDMEIACGETVGIVGRNGSGKSTLLQLIAGTLTPTTGSVEVRGRLAALLELGSGFNPDFTGRENVRLNASVLGLSGLQIDACFDQIVEFSELHPFIDQPVRTYSSGMSMRLAFAVAISIDPDVLIVDEALSVGDAAFQRKCFARIEQLKSQGTTILFVSHAPGSIVELCDRAILLEGGHRLLSGRPKPVVSLYQKLLYAPPGHQASIIEEIRECDRGDSPDSDPSDRSARETVHSLERYEDMPLSASAMQYPERGARILEPKILNDAGRQVNVLSAGREYTYTYEVRFEHDCAAVRFGMMIKSIAGVELFGMASHSHGDSIAAVPAGSTYRVEFRFIARLQPGFYFMNAGCASLYEDGFLHRLVDAVMFRVESASTRMMGGYADLSIEPACRYTTIIQAAGLPA